MTGVCKGETQSWPVTSAAAGEGVAAAGEGVMGMEMSWVRLAHGVGGCLFGHGDLGWKWREVGSRRGRGRFVWWLRGKWFDWVVGE